MPVMATDYIMAYIYFISQPIDGIYIRAHNSHILNQTGEGKMDKLITIETIESALDNLLNKGVTSELTAQEKEDLALLMIIVNRYHNKNSR
jgi:hypothetical protein